MNLPRSARAPAILSVLLLSACFDFDKEFDPCFHGPGALECLGVGGHGSGGEGTPHSGGSAVGGGGSGGGLETGGASGGGGTGGDPGTGGVLNTGGAGSGGAGGSGGTGSLGRLRINEMISSSFVELYNAGTGPYDLTGHTLIRHTGSGYDYFNSCELTGALAVGEFFVVHKSSCSGLEGACVFCPGLTFEPGNVVHVHDGAAAEVHSITYGGSVLVGQSLQAQPDGSDTWVAGTPSPGGTNGN